MAPTAKSLSRTVLTITILVSLIAPVGVVGAYDDYNNDEQCDEADIPGPTKGCPEERDYSESSSQSSAMNGEQYSSEETGVCEADEPLEPPKASFTTTLQCVEAAGWWVGCAGSGGVAFVDSTAGLMVPAEPITYSATAYTCGGAMVQTGECHANLAKDAAESAAEQAGEQLACQ